MTPMPVLLQSAAQVQALPEEAAAGATELANTGAAAAATAPLPRSSTETRPLSRAMVANSRGFGASVKPTTR